MTTGLKLFLGTLAVVGGITYYMHRKNKSMTFETYCENSIAEASKELESTSDSLKTILVLAKLNDSEVAPYFYKKHADGKVTKKRVNYRPFQFDKCPSHVQDSIIRGEYIIHKF